MARYANKFRDPRLRDQLREYNRDYARNRRGRGLVFINYGIFFQTADLVKFGGGDRATDCLRRAKQFLKERNIFWTDGEIIWVIELSESEKIRNEHRLQAEISYTLDAWFSSGRETRMPEWFKAGGRSTEDLNLLAKQSQNYIDRRRGAEYYV